MDALSFRSFNAKNWDRVSKGAYACLLVTGIIIGFTCLRQLTGSTQIEGTILSLLCAALGVFGFFACSSERLSFRTLVLVALGVCGIFTMNFIDQAR